MLPHLIKAFELVPEVKAHLSEKALEFLKSIEQYDRQLWEYTLALFRGGDSGEFIDKFTAAISNQLTRAWNEGSRSVGVEPEDMTEEDLSYLKEIIDNEYEHILDLGTAIEASRELELVEFRQAFRSRIDLWVARYTDVVSRARSYFGNKTRLIWVEGDTKDKCDSCVALDGIVAFAFEWEQSGVRPQSPPNGTLTCGGWECQCRLDVTDKRRSPNALKRIMDIAVAANIGKSMKYSPDQPRVPVGHSRGGEWISYDYDNKLKWRESLTEEERQALFTWGSSGWKIRAQQRGEEPIDEITKNWNNAINRGIKFDGKVYRGMTDVDNETIKDWMDGESITLNNDQSSSQIEDYGKSFTGGGRSKVVWDIEQNSGIDIFGETNVTMGGHSIDEAEIILRKGTEYNIESWDYIREDTGKPFDFDNYFEETEFSKDNLPEGFMPHHEIVSGLYVFKLKEVSK